MKFARLRDPLNGDYDIAETIESHPSFARITVLGELLGDPAVHIFYSHTHSWCVDFLRPLDDEAKAIWTDAWNMQRLLRTR